MNDTKKTIAPLDEGSYQIGQMPQPRHSGGIVVVLLVAVVLLGGVITILGLMNVRLFVALKNQENNALELESVLPSSMDGSIREQTPDFSLELNAASGLQSSDEELTSQQIYTNCIESVVAVRCDTSEGTGLVLTDSGYILTNHQLVQDAGNITVELPNRQSLSARLIGTDPISDLAVLHVQTRLNAPCFADSAELQVGEPVSIISDPLGDQSNGTITSSTVTAVTDDVIRTAADWDYTGPLLDRFGQVVGIHTGESRTAIPSAMVKKIVEELIGQGYVSGRPGLGIRFELVPELHQNYYALPAGLYVTDVFEDVGLSVGDILISLDGQTITSEQDLIDALYACQAGDVVQLEIFRDDAVYTMTVRVVEAKN